jgi:hypothetical protein
MPEGRRVSIYLSDDELAIADATAARLKLSRSEVIRHLVLYQGMCGGDFPLTGAILSQPFAEREEVIREIRERCESGNPILPQAFRKWVKEAAGSDDPEAINRAALTLLQRLLKKDFPTEA